jgi:CheY-like chemotaxis protein/nitrogen-specific signal transduction histidine kinase
VTVRVASALGDLAGAALGTAELYQRQSELRRRAEEADRAKDEFLALLGHELRNPLAPLRNSVQILELRGDDPAVVARTRAMIGRQVGQLTRLVDELLDASRIARGKVRLTPARLDLAALVRTVVGDHLAEAEAAGLSVEVETPDRPVWVRGDAARLAQVATNLFNNAVKFTPAGGRVTVRVESTAAGAALSVSDTGVGIAAEALPTLFQAFRQVDADPARTKGGLGLGLAVVRGLVELHGGRASATSDGAGRGATFSVWLPLDTSAPPATADGDSRTLPPAAVVAVRRVVIIEDGEDAGDSLRELLELRGFEVAVARTGPDGVGLARRVRPDAIVCDLGLPGMTGFEVARTLRADPATAAVPLVAVSGYAQEEDRRNARAAGFDALLAKPADTDELVRLLTRSAS